MGPALFVVQSHSLSPPEQRVSAAEINGDKFKPGHRPGHVRDPLKAPERLQKAVPASGPTPEKPGWGGLGTRSPRRPMGLVSLCPLAPLSPLIWLRTALGRQSLVILLLCLTDHPCMKRIHSLSVNASRHYYKLVKAVCVHPSSIFQLPLITGESGANPRQYRAQGSDTPRKICKTE